MISINELFNMKQFNLQFANHSKLEQLKLFFWEHGTYIELKKGEQFSIQGKMNCRGAYIENGLLDVYKRQVWFLCWCVPTSY